MIRIRVFLFMGLAAIVAFGVCGQPAQAQDIQVREGTHDSMTAVDHWVPNASPDATALAQGPVLWDDGYQVPPCFGPNAPCSSDPAGGVNVGYPIPFWSISGTSSCKKLACGEIDSFTETTSASGAVSATITIRQGKTVIYCGQSPGGVGGRHQTKGCSESRRRCHHGGHHGGYFQEYRKGDSLPDVGRAISNSK